MLLLLLSTLFLLPNSSRFPLCFTAGACVHVRIVNYLYCRLVCGMRYQVNSWSVWASVCQPFFFRMYHLGSLARSYFPEFLIVKVCKQSIPRSRFTKRKSILRKKKLFPYRLGEYDYALRFNLVFYHSGESIMVMYESLRKAKPLHFTKPRVWCIYSKGCSCTVYSM